MPTSTGETRTAPASGDSTHWEVQLQLVKSWPCESQLAGDSYFTSGTINQFRTGSEQRFNCIFHEFIYELKNHHLGLRWLLEEEGGISQHKRVRRWPTPMAWVIKSYKLLNRLDTLPLFSVFVHTEVSQGCQDHLGHPTRPTHLGLKVLWAELSGGIPSARLQAVF